MLCPASFAGEFNPASNAPGETSSAVPSNPFSSCSPAANDLQRAPAGQVEEPAGQRRDPDIDIARHRRRRDRLRRLEKFELRVEPLLREIAALHCEVERRR